MNAVQAGSRVSRTVRAAEAAELRATGMTLADIAKAMGLSYSYVQSLVDDPEGVKVEARRDSYRRPCPQCGRLMTGSDGPAGSPEQCAECAARALHENRYWTRERVLEAIRRWVATRGEIPVSSEWLYKSRAQLTDADGFEYPHVWVVQRECGSWLNAIEQAGYPRPRHGWKRNPRGEAMPTGHTNYVVLREVADGNWQEIGRVPGKHTQENALDEALGALRANGKPPDGRFVAIPERYFLVREARPVTVYQWSRVEAPVEAA